MLIDRRQFLRAALFVAAAPVIVKASSLMKVRVIPFEFDLSTTFTYGFEPPIYTAPAGRSVVYLSIDPAYPPYTMAILLDDGTLDKINL